MASASSVKKEGSDEEPLLLEQNREIIYKLYDKALKLEPEPRFKEPTFSQRQLMNKARKFVTMRMRRRIELRTSKNEKKDKVKARKAMSEQLLKQLRAQFAQQGMIDDETGEVDTDKIQTDAEGKKKFVFTLGGDEEKKESIQVTVPTKQEEKVSSSSNMRASADTGNQAAESEKRQAMRQQQEQQQQADAGSTGGDEVINIESNPLKKKKKRKSKGQMKREAAEREEASGEKKRRVIFKLENNV